MMSPCDGVAERLACGEPLAELGPHAEDCPRCASLRAAEQMLITRTIVRRDAEPSPGFTSRMTVMAGHRLVARHRRRVVGYAALSASAAALLTFALVREPGREPSQLAGDERGAAPETRPAGAIPPEPAEANPWEAPVAIDGVEGEREALELVRLSQTYALPVSANWREIERPLRPYRQLLLLATTPSIESFHSAHDEASSVDEDAN